MNEKEKSRLGKLVNMAKNGTENEKTVAIRIIVNLCSKYNLVYEDVMTETNIQEFTFDYRKRKHKNLIGHIFSRYGVIQGQDQDYGFYKFGQRIYYETTKAKHIEILNAFETLSKAYDDELELTKESFELAFFNKNRLYNYVDADEDYTPPEKTKEEIKKEMMAKQISKMLKQHEVQKRLEQ